MKKYIILTSIALSIIFTNCDNNSKVKKSNKEIDQESIVIENQKEMHQKSIDSLNQEIEVLSTEKLKLSSQIELANAEIFSIVKKSTLDHITIGTTDLSKSNKILTDLLGFKTKMGRKHKNGISNLFIEFVDSSEIELISITNPKDKLAYEYSDRLRKEDFGLQFAIRTNQISHLRKHFAKSNSSFINFNTNQDYSILSNDSFKEQLPFFFIQYHKDNYTNSIHENSAIGINSVWLEVSDLKKTVLTYVDYGFRADNTITVGNYTGKTILMKNDKFEIVFIESNKDKIAGITIKVEDITKLKNIISETLKKEFKINKTFRGKSIALNPKITNSIWIEFLEN